MSKQRLITNETPKHTKLGFRFANPEIDDLSDSRQPKRLFYYAINVMSQLSTIGMSAPEDRVEILKPLIGYREYYDTFIEPELEHKKIPHFSRLLQSDIRAILRTIAQRDGWKHCWERSVIPSIQRTAFLETLNEDGNTFPPTNNKMRFSQFNLLTGVLTIFDDAIFTLQNTLDSNELTGLSGTDKRLLNIYTKKLERQYNPYSRRKSEPRSFYDDDYKVSKTPIYQYTRYGKQNYLRSLLSYLGRKLESNARFISQKEWREVFELFTEVELEARSNGKSFDIEKANNTYMSACLNMSHKEKKKFREDMNELMGMAFDLLKTK